MDNKRSEEIAANRLKVIVPLMDTTLNKDKLQQLKEEICIQTGLSERTIRRYLKDYKEKGFEGLKPKNPGRGGNSIIPEDVIQEAIALRREVPKRSITELIRILEWKGKVEPGFLRRSTLQDQLNYRGYSSRQMLTYASSVTGARRFQKPWRNYLWQSDIKYGIYVNGQPTFMVRFLDDCTRHVLHSEFYPTLNQSDIRQNEPNQEVKEIKINYCMDMTYLASLSDEPFFGREKELEQIITVLMCRKKNNILILGEAGVGKTALVEALAKRIIQRKVPEELLGSHVLSLNLAALLGGASGRGEFEERVEELFQNIKNAKVPIIVFIDEFHSIVGLGNEGKFDLANLLKPVLARKEIKCIGATTFREFKIYIEKDGALVRRFKNIGIMEPSKEETYQILCNVKNAYEEYHKVQYLDEAIRACVDLADKYILNRHFPDKALSWMRLL